MRRGLRQLGQATRHRGRLRCRDPLLDRRRAGAQDRARRVGRFGQESGGREGRQVTLGVGPQPILKERQSRCFLDYLRAKIIVYA